MYVPETAQADICGFCRSYYQDNRLKDVLLIGVCGNIGTARILVKYGEKACDHFTDGIKSIIEQCFREGVY